MNDTITQDAHEFGRHVRNGGWALGLLVARNVKPGTGNPVGKTPAKQANALGAPKVSASAFAKKASTSLERVMRYLDAWNAAAEAGIVRHADTLNPGDIVRLPDPEQWTEFYKATERGEKVSTSGTERSARALAKTDPLLVNRLFDSLPAEQKEMVAIDIAKLPEFAKAIASDDVVRDEFLGAVLGTPEKRKAAIEDAERTLISKHPLIGWQTVIDGFGDANRALVHALDGLVKLAINASINPDEDPLGVARGRAEMIGRSIHEIEMAWGETPITDKIEELRDNVRS